MVSRITLVLLALCALLPGARAACEHMPWLEKYVRFHAEQRGNASAPTLTVWKRGHQWGGHGDVFRHFLWALRFAAATRRVYYISAENPPLPLTEIMSPAAIAWTVPDELRRAAPALPKIDSLTLAQ